MHTPGPWKVANYGGIENCIVPASAIPQGGLYQSGEYICTTHDTLNKTKAANAALIAAAPMLLEALKQWEGVISIAISIDKEMARKFPRDGSMLTMTRAAIAAAEGGA